MNEFIAAVAVYLSLGVLLWSGASHARHPFRFKRLIIEHGIWPAGLEWLMAGAVIVLEFGAGLLVVIFFMGETFHRFGQMALGAATGLYLAYALYAAYLLRRRPGVPCACSGTNEATTVWTLVRAGILAVAGLVGLLWADEVMQLPAARLEGLLSLMASVALGLIVWNLPAALLSPHDPNAQIEEAIPWRVSQ